MRSRISIVALLVGVSMLGGGPSAVAKVPIGPQFQVSEGRGLDVRDRERRVRHGP